MCRRFQAELFAVQEEANNSRNEFNAQQNLLEVRTMAMHNALMGTRTLETTLRGVETQLEAERRHSSLEGHSEQVEKLMVLVKTRRPPPFAVTGVW